MNDIDTVESSLESILRGEEMQLVESYGNIGGTHFIFYKQPHFLAEPGKEIEIATSK